MTEAQVLVFAIDVDVDIIRDLVCITDDIRERKSSLQIIKADYVDKCIVQGCDKAHFIEYLQRLVESKDRIFSTRVLQKWKQPLLKMSLTNRNDMILDYQTVLDSFNKSKYNVAKTTLDRLLDEYLLMDHTVDTHDDEE